MAETNENKTLNYDTSTVYNINILDEEYAKVFLCHKPWIFETDEQQLCFKTENEACAKQRDYRVQKGFNKYTGEE